MQKIKFQKKYLFLSSFFLVNSVFALETGNFATSYSLTHGKYEEIPARKVRFPFYVYGNESGNLSDFVASGFMGDMQSLKTVASSSDASAPASTGRTGKTTLRVEYKPMGRNGWAGIYWQSPANNWGKIKGAGFNLSKASHLSFWARGEKGGEALAAFKVGGIVGPYPDSDSVILGPVKLGKEWKQYKMDLKGKDMRHIIGGFSFQIRRADNPSGATFYLDEIVFNGEGEDDIPVESVVEEVPPPVVVATAKIPKVVNSPVVVADVAPPVKVIYKKRIVPRIIYVDKPVYVYQTKNTGKVLVEMTPFKPVHRDFFFDLLRRAMTIQPFGYGNDIPLYMWAKYIERKWISHPKQEISARPTESAAQVTKK